MFGHINNVVYYSFFDTAVTHFLIEAGCLKIKNNPIVFYVVHTSCNFITSLSYPEEIEAGLRVEKLGNSSVRYGIAIFRKGESSAVAHGHFVHVFVNRDEQKSAPIPDNLRLALEKIKI